MAWTEYRCWFKLASFLSHNSSPSLLVISPYFYWWEVPLWTDLICYGEVGSQRIQALILFVQRLTSLQQSSHPHWLSQWSPMNHLCKKLPLDLKFHLCSPLIHLNIEKVSCDPTLITKNHHFLMLCHDGQLWPRVSHPKCALSWFFMVFYWFPWFV